MKTSILCHYLLINDSLSSFSNFDFSVITIQEKTSIKLNYFLTHVVDTSYECIIYLILCATEPIEAA